MRKKCSKIGFIFVLIIMVVALTANITYADSDPSQPSSWAKAEIEKAKEINLLPERLQGEYRSNITREEFSEIAVNLYEALSGKEAELQGENPFTDTQSTEVRIANSLGIVKGIGDGRFAPDNAITRQEISVMMYRTLQAAKPGYDYSKKYEHIFADYDMISSWAREAVSYLYVMEIVNGVGDNQFSPKGNTTREQAIVLANRMHDKVSATKDNLIASRDGTSRRENDLKLELAKLISQELGKPYKWGGTGPDGYDCSGLVYSIYSKLGIPLPRTARDQAGAGTYVSKEELQYGDLVLFARDGKNINHVGIYVGDGKMVHSPQTGDVVKFTTIMSGYYERCYYTARRVIN
ncbi:MAG TPA: NlpC/P60 family protein [Bacillota bacterium]|mgnify:FL=1|nr:NlpC/P60 family protein [Bacillota bacterium]